MNDRELLEKAARAIGREFEPGFTETFWNPLACDKDAFHLMSELKISVIFDNSESDVAAKSSFREDLEWLGEEITHELNEKYATRRAITRAAAAMADEDNSHE